MAPASSTSGDGSGTRQKVCNPSDAHDAIVNGQGALAQHLDVQCSQQHRRTKPNHGRFHGTLTWLIHVLHLGSWSPGGDDESQLPNSWTVQKELSFGSIDVAE